MSKHKAAGGKASQHVSPSGKRLGIKVDNDQTVTPGMVLIRQRGSSYGMGNGVARGRDFTLFAVSKGKVKFGVRLGKKTISVS